MEIESITFAKHDQNLKMFIPGDVDTNDEKTSKFIPNVKNQQLCLAKPTITHCDQIGRFSQVLGLKFPYKSYA